MRIFVKTLTGKTIILNVEPTTKVGPVPSIPLFTLCGGKGITVAKIQGEATSVLVKAAAQEMSRFWHSPDGLAVREYLEKNVINTGEISCSQKADSVHIDSNASLDELLIEASRFFILKALNGDTAAPMLAAEAPSKRVGTKAASCGAQLSPSWYVDQVWHALLLFPQTYHQLCMRLVNEMICHDPRSDDRNQTERYSLTFKKYSKLFGKGPPSRFWPMPALWETDQELCKDGSGLKGMICDADGVPPDEQALIFAGQHMEDARYLHDYNIADLSTVHLALKLRGC